MTKQSVTLKLLFFKAAQWLFYSPVVGQFEILATKTQRHEATQSILRDIFVPWCLGGISYLILEN